MAALLTCTITGQANIPQGGAVATAQDGYIAVHRASKAGNNLVILPFTVSPSGETFTIVVPRNCTIYTSGNVDGFWKDSDGNYYSESNPKALTVPDAATATLESLVAVASIPSEGLTVKDEGTALASLIGTLNFVGSGVSVAQASAGVATVTIAGGGGGATALDDLTDVTITSAANDDILQRKAGVFVNRTLAQLKTDLTLSGTNTGDQDLSGYSLLAHNHSGVYEPADADLSVIAGLSPSNDEFLQRKAGGWANRTIAQVKSDLNLSGSNTGDQDLSGLLVKSSNLSDLTNAGTARTNLGLAIGTNVQAFNSNLSTFAGITPSANVQTLLGAADFAAFKSSLSLNLVENTALSGWVGSSNLTTLGTIGTGSWNATAIPFAKLAFTGTPDGTKFLRDDGSWQAAGGGSGASLALDNLASVAINTALLTGAGVAAAFTATPLAQITTAQAGIAATLTASAAIAGSSVAGAAAGGSVTLTAGAAARLTSGNANGGNINLNPGAGIGTGTAGNVFIGAGLNGLVIGDTSTIGITATQQPYLNLIGNISGGIVGPLVIKARGDINTFGAGITLNTAGTSGGTYTIFASGSGASVGAALLTIYDNVAGAHRQVMDANGNFIYGSAALLGWSSTAGATSTKDSAIARNAVGVIEVNNGTAGQWGSLKVGVRDAGTTTVTNGLTIGHQSTGTPAAGLGSGILFNINSSTTADQNAAQIAALWDISTHASRSAALSLRVVENAAALAEAMRLDRSATADNTGMMLWDANSGTVKRVTVGATDSGGTGFRMLRIVN